MPVITRSKQRAMDHDTALVQLHNTSLNNSSTDYSCKDIPSSDLHLASQTECDSIDNTSSSLTKSPMDSKLSILSKFQTTTDFEISNLPTVDTGQQLSVNCQSSCHNFLVSNFCKMNDDCNDRHVQQPDTTPSSVDLTSLLHALSTQITT
jgi:hypothetical protein